MNDEKQKKHNGVIDGFRQFMRNGRWGTCVGCPRDKQNRAYPEFCSSTKRYDHQLNVDELAHMYKAHTRDDS